MAESRQGSEWRHWFAILTALATLPLIFVGGAVTSKGAGLSVPDWPLSFGEVMPPHWMRIDHVFYEHSHRLLGAGVGLLVLIQAIWMGFCEPRRPLRLFAHGLLAGVVVQGIMGGQRVELISTALAVVHGCFAQVFFAGTVVMALVTSRRWQAGPAQPTETRGFSRRLAVLAAGAVLLQLVLGAVTRHTGTTILPHALWAVVVMAVLHMTMGRILADRGQPRPLRQLAVLAGVLVVLQVMIGLLTWMITSGMDENVSASLMQWLLPTAHVVIGALLLALCVVLTAGGAGRTQENNACQSTIENVPLSAH
ncbi:MAG: hypothetical protein GY778_05695 [bacterium]|nr:hypothetical protein [bacterium]